MTQCSTPVILAPIRCAPTGLKSGIARLFMTGLFVFVFGLTGCSLLPHQALPHVPTDNSLTPAIKDVRQLQKWTLDGKVGVRFLGESISATYRWQRLDQDFDAEAAGPLDQGHTNISARSGLITLENAWLGKHESYDAEGLTKVLTTMPIPLNSFNNWLMGWPVNSQTPVQNLATEVGVREFTERDWTIRVLSEQVVAGYRIPARLQMTQANNRLLLVIAHWQPGAL